MRNEMKSASGGKKIKVTKDGPYVVSGGVPLDEQEIVVEENNDPLEWKKNKTYPNKSEYLLCRCGKSKNMPYCDKSHINSDFDGTESEGAKKKYVEMEEVFEGPKLVLHDAYDLCSIGRFCERSKSVWNLIEEDSEESTKTAIEECKNCPSGRLVVHDKSGKIIETKLNQEISVTQEPNLDFGGPIWVKGGIEIESESGEKYEKRNRVTLCRCGKSTNKPFCDGTHKQINFSDKS